MAQAISLGWKTRLAILASLGWLAIALIISLDRVDVFGHFMLIGVLPIGLLGGAAWVWAGYQGTASKSHRRRRTHRQSSKSDEKPADEQQLTDPQ